MRLLKTGIVLLIILIGANLFPMVSPAPAAVGRLVADSLESPALAANLLGDSARREVSVCLPDRVMTRQPDSDYPVVYLLHGFKAKNKLWTGQGRPGQGLGLQELADDLINRKIISPLIIVMPDADNAYGGGFYLNSAVTGQSGGFYLPGSGGLHRPDFTAPFLQPGPGGWLDIPWEATGLFGWVCTTPKPSAPFMA